MHVNPVAIADDVAWVVELIHLNPSCRWNNKLNNGELAIGFSEAIKNAKDCECELSNYEETKKE